MQQTIERKEEKKTFCRVCEPACGMIATLEDGKLTALKPDPEHPVTRGFVCHKGIYGLDIHNDPDRLKVPLKRSASGAFVETTWDEVIPEIAHRLNTVLSGYGPGALASYRGNPMAFNALFGPSFGAFLGQIGVTKNFSSGTQDCSNKFAGSGAVFGTQTLHPVPDIEHTDLLLILGENPAVSHMSFISIADPVGELRKAEERGARIIYINPRTIETARFAGEVVRIRPDTDVYFLAALLCEIDRIKGFDQAAVDTYGRNIDRLRAFVAEYPPHRVAEVTGIPAPTIEDIARQFADAPRAAVHMSTGVNMGRQGTLAYWLVHMLSFVTGNLGRRGGNFYGAGFYARATRAGRIQTGPEDVIEGPHGPMRAPGSPLIGLPGNLMPDYILDQNDPVKAMIVVGGNPLLSVGGEDRLRRALQALECLICVDIYRNATAEYAHYVLPAAGAFEREDVNITGLGLQYRPSIQYTEAMVDPAFERKPEWWMFEKIAQAMGLRSLFDPDAPADLWARTDAMLRSRGHAMQDLKEKGTIVFEPPKPEELFDHIQTEDGRIDCFPPAFADALVRMDTIFTGLAQEPADQLKLITKRDSHMMNSWYANLPKMKRKDRAANYLYMNSEDGRKRQLRDGDKVTVRSAHGSVGIELRLTEDLMPGVVAMPHGWGHRTAKGMAFASKTPGVNANALLPSGPGSFEPLSNMAHMTGIPVEVAKSA